MKSIAIYYRVSTDRQDLDSQKYAVEKYLEELEKKPQSMQVFEEKGMSGKDHNRPEFKRMMNLAIQAKFDTIVVYRLDRFSRDANMAIRTILELDQYGVGFVSVTQPVLNLGHGNPFRRTLLAAFAEIAEIERETIVMRVRAGLDAAKKRGVKLGAPARLTRQMQTTAKEKILQGASFRDIASELGVSTGSVSKLINGPEIDEK